ncbi:MAG TPA: transglutaminase domain-containing protein [Patescibacteria group bacterium]|nr:transglutaminase domain-containing protein [Patescibacteria group bacterium]
MKKFLLLFFFVSFLIFPRPAFADDNFQTSYVVTYAIQQNGVTNANFAISMQNLNDKYYATVYTLKLGFQNISNVHASDPDGAIIPRIVMTKNGEEISLAFNKHVAGKDKVLPFFLSFDTTDIATHNGSVWEVNVPGLENQSNFSAFTVRVSVPQSFGSPTYIKPETGSTGLTFSKEQLGSSGISLAFGAKQAFGYLLTYHLKNDQLFPVTTAIALPPDTSYQQVALDSLLPKPQSVTRDADGNWFAHYALNAGQTITAIAKGTVFLSLSPRKTALSSEERRLYTGPLKYWETTDPHIVGLSRQLQTPDAIYAYVVRTLHYNFARVSTGQQRLGAATVLQRPDDAVCLEFTDLFIALARAAGIPAREIDGYAYTQNTSERPLSKVADILHAWPEYYDSVQQAWVMVDPTWENTTGGIDYFHSFDFDHVAFVVKGVNSEYPVPAGGYKLAGKQSEKDVSVMFSPQVEFPVPQVGAQILVPNEIFSGFPLSGVIQLTNTGTTLFPSQQMTITSNKGVKHAVGIVIPAIPPMGQVGLPFSFGNTPFLTNTKDTITIHLAQRVVSREVVISPFSVHFLSIIGGVIVGLLCFVLLIIAAKPWRLFISKRER